MIMIRQTWGIIATKPPTLWFSATNLDFGLEPLHVFHVSLHDGIDLLGVHNVVGYSAERKKEQQKSHHELHCHGTNEA